MPPSLLDVRDVTRSLPLGEERIDILRGVTFSVDRGDWLTITGASGSGKSTLLGILSGLDRPSAGRVFLDGVDISDMGEGALAGIRNAHIGIVFQSFNLISTLTARENVEAPLYVGAKRREARARATAMLARVGLEHRLDHLPGQLSGGEQQRVAIARALVTDPALLVADEPTGNLDSKTTAHVLDLFAALHAELDVTLIVVTHDETVARRANRRLHIVDGRLADSGGVAT